MTRFPHEPYAYLLGLYLGDGCIVRSGRSLRLGISMDSRYPELFLRGLIQSDGCRVMNKVWGGKHEYPRYFFNQVSTDIMGLFCRTCDQLGIEYRFNNPTSVSIAKARSVARLDAFVGPKR